MQDRECSVRRAVSGCDVLGRGRRGSWLVPSGALAAVAGELSTLTKPDSTFRSISRNSLLRGGLTAAASLRDAILHDPAAV